MSPGPEAPEAGRAPTGELLPGGAERSAAGWQRRFVVDQSRVVEMVRLYQALGYETAVDPIRPEDLPGDPAGTDESMTLDGMDPRCGDCRLVTMRWLHVIYTRPAPPSPAD